MFQPKLTTTIDEFKQLVKNKSITTEEKAGQTLRIPQSHKQIVVMNLRSLLAVITSVPYGLPSQCHHAL